MHTRPPFLLFTDLDGTLLDHRTYSADAAMPALEWLKQKAIPLIFCSSKTPEEQVCLQEKLGIRQPFIFENGGGAGIPVEMPAMEDNLLIEPLGAYRLYYFSSVTAAEIRHFLKEIAIKTGLKLSVFDDLTPEEMQMVTGLPPEAHARASARRCSMTIARTLDEDSIRQLALLCRERGLALSRGGRFYTLTDEKVDKG
ncbi:MAG: HAD hydrolase family protein, partial [Saprospiraceae bacterium]|nr:HAD hydrolase family protein [Saprospiraceae bacterium]